jgi:hypothetical protein
MVGHNMINVLADDLTCLLIPVWVASVIAWFMLVYAVWQIMRTMQRMEARLKRWQDVQSSEEVRQRMREPYSNP